MSANSESIDELRSRLEKAEMEKALALRQLKELTEGLERYSPSDLLRKGGEWLGAARSWIQRKAVNGERVTWGSNDVLEMSVTVSQIEDLAADVASMAMRPQPSEKRFISSLKARWEVEYNLNDIIEYAVDAALSEVRRQGGADYLLKEARNTGIAAGSVRAHMLMKTGLSSKDNT